MSIRWASSTYFSSFLASAIDFGFEGEVKAPHDQCPHPRRPLASKAAVIDALPIKLEAACWSQNPMQSPNKTQILDLPEFRARPILLEASTRIKLGSDFKQVN